MSAISWYLCVLFSIMTLGTLVVTVVPEGHNLIKLLMTIFAACALVFALTALYFRSRERRADSSKKQNQGAAYYLYLGFAVLVTLIFLFGFVIG